MSPDEKKEILAKIEKYAGEGLKVLGLSYKEEGELKETKNHIWLGLAGIEDPIREGVRETIQNTLEAGIKIKIVTGDHRKTAQKVAKNLGFLIKKENIMDGHDLEKISDKELKRIIDRIILFARVSPHQKLKIIKVLQEKGEIVAMTGDGVNDAPALKRADIGVVLGNSSDVAKEAGDLILLDNNFKTIVSACEEGRLIFSNIKKVVGYVLSNAFDEIIVIAGAFLFALPFPLTVVQILWINLICDGPPDFMLGFEPKEESLMKEKPRKIGKEDILSNSMKFLIFFISLAAGGFSLLFFWYFYNHSGDIVLARTVVFATIATASLVYIFSFKSLKESIFKINIFQNKFLFLGVIYGFALIFLAVYLPGLNRLLGTTPLLLKHWFLVFGVAVFTTFLAEIVKYFKNKNFFAGRV
jgi:Ca2+-transporting ATPase